MNRSDMFSVHPVQGIFMAMLTANCAQRKVPYWLLPLLAVTLVRQASSQNVHNLTAAPGQSLTLLADPNNPALLSVDVVWEEEGVDAVVGLMDGSVDYSPDTGTFSPADASTSTKGSATFTVDTDALTEGRHTLDLTSTMSGGSQSTLTVVIFIQDPIDAVQNDNFRLSPASSVLPLPDGTASITVSVSNSTFVAAVLCHWDFGVADGTTEEVALNLPADFPTQGSFSYTTVGTYSVRFRCRNTLSSAVELPSTVETVGWAMSDFAMDVVDFLLMNGTAPTEVFVLRMTLKTIQRPPQGISASFIYGDGTPTDSFPLTTLSPTHLYPKRGIYKGSVYLDHPSLGNITLDFTARVGAFQLYLNTQGGLVASEVVTFSVGFPKRFLGLIYHYYGDGQSSGGLAYNAFTEGNSTTHHTYPTIDFYTARFVGISQLHTNPYYERADFPGPIEIDSAVDETLELTVSPETVLTPTGEVTATVLLTRTVHKILSMECLFVFNEAQAPDTMLWSGTLLPGGTFEIPFQYKTLGSHDIVANCSNSFSNHTLSFFVFAYHPCFSDDPIFDRQYRLNKPMVALNSLDLRLVTRTIIFCPMPSFWWWVEDFNGNSEHADLVQPYTDYIEFKKGTLKPALYKMSVNITFGPEQNYTWLVGSIFVKIVQTPLVAEISGGRIRLTGDSRAVINGYNLSYDPVSGIDNKTDLQFVWQCHTFSTANFDELVAVSSRPLWANLSTTCDDISTEVLPGQRELKIASGVTAMGFAFKMRVTKNNVTSKPATVFIQYVGTSFTILVNCVVNCLSKTAVTSPVSFTVVCDTCSDADMQAASYAWSLALYNNGTGQFQEVPDAQSYFSQSGPEAGPTLAINENSLEPCQRYRVMVRVTSASGQDTAAVLQFLTNCPPWGGNCTVVPNSGNVVTQRFTIYCPDWQDDGFVDVSGEEDDDDESKDEENDGGLALYYKFMLRKNGITVPIAEGGQSTMPRIQLPLIVGQGGGEYQLITRIYDVLQDYTEVSADIYLNASSTGSSDALSGDSLQFWKDQVSYSVNSSTLNKQLRGMSTASALLATSPVPEDRSTLEIAADSNASAVVDQDWTSLWYDLNNPIPNPTKDGLTELTKSFSQTVQVRGNESAELSGQGIAALGEGMVAVLDNPDTTDDESVLTTVEVAEKGAEALRKLFTTVPFPIGDRLDEAVYSMTGMIDRILSASLPSYDLSIGAGLLFNSSDVSEDDSSFMVSRLKVADAVRDRRKMNTTQTAMPKLSKAVDTMLDTLLSGLVSGQPQLQVKRDGIALAVGKMSGRALSNSTVTASNLQLQMDSVDDDGAESDPDAQVEVKASVYNKNPFAWASDASSYEITSPVVRVNMTDSKGPRKLRQLTMRLNRGENTPVPVIDTYSSADTRAGPDGWLFHRMTLRSGSSAVVTRFQLPSNLSQVVAYFRTGRAPTSSRYDVRLSGELVLSRRRRDVTGNGTDGSTGTRGGLYQFFVPPGSLSPGIVFVGFYLPELDMNSTTQYGFSSFSDMCRVWNEDTETWDSSSCTVSASSSPEATVCVCSNPPGTSFASSFFVAPNTIDFSTVFLKFDFTNASVYGTLIGLLCLWVLALLWARRKDRQDRQRWLVGYLADNHIRDRHFYLMTVYTGMRRGAGTQSNVRFVLTGSKARNRVRRLSDGERALTTGSVLTYIMTTRQELGQLRFLRLWHDDSGEGQNASWYLSRVVVEDLQNGERYNFICERWFARDKEDGLIDRVVAVTLKDETLAFDRLFNERARIEITDSHLWLSCVLRPERSTFTRMQRVSCCFALLLLTMLTSALFYQPEDNETGESNNKLGMEVSVGPLRFSLTTVWTSTVSIVITTIPVFIFVILFRSYRPRPGPRVRIARQHREGTTLAKIRKKFSVSRQKVDDVEQGQGTSGQNMEEAESQPDTEVGGRIQKITETSNGNGGKTQTDHQNTEGTENKEEMSENGDRHGTEQLGTEQDQDTSNNGTQATKTSPREEIEITNEKAQEDEKALKAQEDDKSGKRLEEEVAEKGQEDEKAVEKDLRKDEKPGKDQIEEETVKNQIEEETGKDQIEEETGNDQIEEETDKHQTEEETDKNQIEEETGKDQIEEETRGKSQEYEKATEVRQDENLARNLSDILQNMLQQNPLPHYCVYLTWSLLLVTMVTCLFFLILFSMQWGSTTSEEWLAAFFISFFESFFLMDPIKVLILACLLAYCAGNPFSDTQHQYVDISRVHEEAKTCGTEKIDCKTKPPKPVPEDVLEAARTRRREEQLAQSVFFELIFYFIFVLCIFSLSYGNRDQRTYRTNEHLANMLYSADGHAPFPFESISSREDVLRYMNETLRFAAFPWTDLLGNELHWRRRLFASDGVSFRVGPIRVRQLRMSAVKSLKVTRWYPTLRSSNQIHPPYDSYNEDRGSYCIGWKSTPCSDEELSAKLSTGSWNYVTDVLPVSIWGTHAYYSSGGYIVDFTVNRDVVAKTVEELAEGVWLDLQTRAVFVELCLYNPSTNLFTFLRMGAEFPELGANSVWKDLKTLRLYSHHGAMGAFVLVCQLLALLFLLVFTVQAILKIKRQMMAYFTDFWQVLDLLTLIVAYTALVFYVTKILSVDEVMESWRHDPKIYVDFYLPVLWDTIYGYILAALVFVVSVRLLRVLGYNQRVTMLATVLARSGHQLVGYAIVFFIVLSAYVSTSHILFVSVREQFRSLADTYSTMYIVLLGRNRIGKWIRTSPLWAQAYFISLTLLLIFVLYSMFEAILCNTTSQVKAKVDSIPPPYGLTNFLAKFYRSVVTDWVPARFVRSNTEDPDSSKGTPTDPSDPLAAAGNEGALTQNKQNASKDVVKKLACSSHRPDDKMPSSAVLLEDLRAEMKRLKQEMRETLARQKEDRRRRREKRRRLKEAAAAADRISQQKEEEKGNKLTASSRTLKGEKQDKPSSAKGNGPGVLTIEPID